MTVLPRMTDLLNRDTDIVAEVDRGVNQLIALVIE